MADEIRDVFISYHEASAGELAGQIADKLERSDITCWYAKRDLPSGADFADHIPQQIDGCKAFLLILNQNSAYSDFVRNELGIAFNRRDKRGDIEILPFQWEDCVNGKLDFFLTSIQIIRVADGPTEKRVQFLAEAVARKLGRELLDKDAERKAELERVIVKTRDFLEHELCLDEDRTTYVLNALARTYQPNPPQTRMPFFLPLSKRIVDSGTLGNLKWTLDSERCLTIFGHGEMESVGTLEKEMCNPSWLTYSGVISSVIIQDGVTSIADNAFSGCEQLWNVTIPDSVTSIGKFAFQSCAHLQNIRIPDGVTIIQKGTFSQCKNLRRVRIPSSVTSIEESAFAQCDCLNMITIPKSVIEIKENAFANCSRLKMIAILSEKFVVTHMHGFRNCVILRPKGKHMMIDLHSMSMDNNRIRLCDFDADGNPIL